MISLKEIKRHIGTYHVRRVPEYGSVERDDLKQDNAVSLEATVFYTETKRSLNKACNKSDMEQKNTQYNVQRTLVTVRLHTNEKKIQKEVAKSTIIS